MSAHPNLPEGWQYDPYWRAAAHILEGFPTDDHRIWAHISTTGIDYPAILAEGWSGGQRITEAIAIMRDGLR